MYTTKREQQRFRFQNDAKIPSFSSTLLDKIYRSIDESNDMKLYNETMGKKQSRVVVEEEEITAASIRRACLLEKWNRSEKVGTQRKTQTEGKTHRHHHRHHEHDQEVMFFSSTSSSSDSSSGLLSSSDTESLYGLRSKSRASCFAPPRPRPRPRPKPVMTSSSNEEGLIKSKSRALKIYNNLKKVKQPISPGGKLSNFLNSLFATGGSVKKTKTYDDKKASKPGQDSTCSSASTFSRSCLSKATPSSSKDSLRDGVKRTVRFYPVSVILNEDSRPCGHKCLNEEDTRVMAWKIGRKKNEDEESRVVDNSRRAEEAAREFLKDYHRSQRKSDLINSRDFTNLDDDNEDDDDAASCSSSDLFELDHLAVMGNNRYREELPVYETTYVSTNRAIANGLI